jgi:hypothetical protein
MLGITSQDKPHLSGMRPSAALFEWQPVAIAAFLKMVKDPLLIGGLLADDVGFGKTWTTTGFLLMVSHKSSPLLPRGTDFNRTCD